MNEKKYNVSGDAGGGRETSIKVNLPGNSNKDKTISPKTKSEERPKPERITSQEGVIQKKSFGTKIKETFTGEDARSVGNYLFFDVIVPAFKAMLADTAAQGTERLLFGSSTSRSRPNDRERRNIPYSRMSTSRGSRESSLYREFSDRDRATHNFDNIRVDSRPEAEEVLDALANIVDEYGSARVSDLYEMVGISGKFTDDNWGWFSLRDSGVRRVRDGYLILLPRPEPID